MDLKRYLQRIGWSGTTRPTLQTLGEWLRAHNHNIPFENLDVQLGKPLTTRIEEAYEKLVMQVRGGWCYEQNGVLGWALSQAGFEVRRIAGSVMRKSRGRRSQPDHLTLIVTLPDDQSRWLVDAGFGGSLLQPIPLREGYYMHAPFKLGLRQLDDGYWQFWENLGTYDFSFDFEDTPADERAMSACCKFLQTDADSGFVKTFVCQVRRPDSHLALRGRVLTEATNNARRERILGSADELVATLNSEFGLDVPEAVTLWPRICERHEQFMSGQSAG